MEIDPQEKSRVWWGGAIKAALKGIPQGILLGTLAAAVLVGGVYALGAMGFMGTASMLGGAFGSFVFSMTTAGAPSVAATAFAAGTLPPFSLAILSPLPIIVFNTVLTSIGNFLGGGDIAVAKYQQEFDHAKNDARIRGIEAREHMVEQVIASPQRSRVVDTIIANGPRTQQTHAATEEAREAQTPPGPTLH